MSDESRPADIYEDSGFRLPLPKRDELDDAVKPIYDRLADSAGGSLAGLQGPGGMRLYSARVAEHTHALSQYLRGEAGFSGQVRELAILVTAREMDSQFEWAAHEPAGQREGLSQDVIDIVKHRRAEDGLPETEAVVIRLGREIYGERYVAPETFARALKLFGRRGLVDLVSLMGQYAATATILTAFDMQLRPGTTPPLPVA